MLRTQQRRERADDAQLSGCYVAGDTPVRLFTTLRSPHIPDGKQIVR
jgi:hypothetical protein